MTEKKSTQNKYGEIPEIPGMNVLEGIERAAGNIDLYYKLLDSFVISFKNFDVNIQTELDQGHREVAERLAHSLKGVAGNLGAMSLFAELKLLEAELRKDAYHKKDCEKILSNILPLLEAIIKGIEKSKEIRFPKEIHKINDTEEEFGKVKDELLKALKESSSIVTEIYEKFKLFSNARVDSSQQSKLNDAIVSYDHELALEILTNMNP